MQEKNGNQHGEHHHSKEEHKEHGKEHNHREHHRMMIRDFRRRSWVSAILTVPILLLSSTIQQWLGLEWDFQGRAYILFGLSALIYFYGGWPFLKGSRDELRERNPGMMTLIGLAITVAFAYSSAVAFGLSGKTFFWELATLIDIMLVGHWIEMRSILGASRALEELMALLPDEAHLIDGEEVRDVPVKELRSGDLILIKPGEKIPADGTIKEGESELNEGMITGESTPVHKKPGDEVIGGAVNGSNSLRVQVEGVGEDSYLSKVVNMVEEAQSKKSKSQRLADRAAFWLTIVSISVGTITFAVWMSLGRDLAFSMERMVTVMVITCPHALGLAIPLVAAISTSLSAQNGLLIRNRTAFENARKIDTLVFDKTGTLTTGEFGVSGLGVTDDEWSEEELLRVAGALEADSEHPIARGIMAELAERSLQPRTAKDFEAITGKGVIGQVEDRTVAVVSPGYLQENDLEPPAEATDQDGDTVVFVLVEEKLIGWIALADRIRPESPAAIQALKELDIRTVMLTGDNKTVAGKVSAELGLDDYLAEVLPDQKLEEIKKMQSQGAFVAMTGDGINDAPALAQADVGIAVGSGTDVAAETADIILVESNPEDVLNAIRFGKSTYRKMVQNLIWATAYNVVAIPLAAGLLLPWGVMISPAFGAVLMSLSTVIVAVNAQLLKVQFKDA